MSLKQSGKTSAEKAGILFDRLAFSCCNMLIACNFLFKWKTSA